MSKIAHYVIRDKGKSHSLSGCPVAPNSAGPHLNSALGLHKQEQSFFCTQAPAHNSEQKLIQILRYAHKNLSNLKEEVCVMRPKS
jgi:hypothetical protein